MKAIGRRLAPEHGFRPRWTTSTPCRPGRPSTQPSWASNRGGPRSEVTVPARGSRPRWRCGRVTSRRRRHYLGAAPASPYAAPARAADLSGLPPAYIATAEFCPNRDEDITAGRTSRHDRNLGSSVNVDTAGNRTRGWQQRGHGTTWRASERGPRLSPPICGRDVGRGSARPMPQASLPKAARLPSAPVAARARVPARSGAYQRVCEQLCPRVGARSRGSPASIVRVGCSSASR
jgi:hypothetical protein